MRIVWAMGLAVLILAGFFSLPTMAGTYELSNGQTLIGDPIAPDREGILFKTGPTTISPRIAWTNFTETALRSLMRENPETRRYVVNLIYDVPELEETVVKRPDVRIQAVARLHPPEPRSGFLALFVSPVGLFLFVMLYAANIYGGYAIGQFRSFNPIVVAVAAAVLPVIGPFVFLILPKGGDEELMDEEDEMAEDQEAYEEPVAAETTPAEEALPPALPETPETVVYERGRFTFNRRFFETKLAPFMRVVPGEESKDLVLEIDSVRGHHIGSRVSKVLPSELHLHVKKGDASADVVLPFAEIKSVTIRPKEG